MGSLVLTDRAPKLPPNWGSPRAVSEVVGRLRRQPLARGGVLTRKIVVVVADPLKIQYYIY